MIPPSIQERPTLQESPHPQALSPARWDHPPLESPRLSTNGQLIQQSFRFWELLETKREAEQTKREALRGGRNQEAVSDFLSADREKSLISLAKEHTEQLKVVERIAGSFTVALLGRRKETARKSPSPAPKPKKRKQ